MLKRKIRKTGNKIETSDEPGNYEQDELASSALFKRKTSHTKRIKNILLLCVKNQVVTREMIKKNYSEKDVEEKVKLV